MSISAAPPLLGGERLLRAQPGQTRSRLGEDLVEGRERSAAGSPIAVRLHVGDRSRSLPQRTSIVPGAPSSTSPITGPAISFARLAATAISNPPDVIASAQRTSRPGIDPVAEAGEGGGVARVAAGAAGDAVGVRRELERPVDARHRRGVDPHGYAARERELVGVADQPEAGHVGRRRGPRRDRLRGRGGVEGRHHLDRPRDQPVVGPIALRGGRDEAGAERLGQDQDIAGTSARIGEHPGRIDEPGHRQAVLRFPVLDRMAAADHGAGLIDHRLTAARGSARGPPARARRAGRRRG